MKPAHFKLFAFYNGKDKAIGVASFDLALFVNKGVGAKTEKTKQVFQKCFDKTANIVYSVKWTELIEPIQE